MHDATFLKHILFLLYLHDVTDLHSVIYNVDFVQFEEPMFLLSSPPSLQMYPSLLLAARLIILGYVRKKMLFLSSLKPIKGSFCSSY